MYISIIIPTLNRSAFLNDVLDSIMEMDKPDMEYEVIVVDNGSTDSTKDVVHNAINRCDVIKYIFEPNKGLHNARHAGLKSSSGKWIAYLDDDIYLSNSWLRSIHDIKLEDDIALITGRVMPDYEISPPIWVNDLWQKTKYGNICICYSLCDLGNELINIPATYAFGCNFIIKRSVLLECCGFHPDGVPDDQIMYRGDGETSVARKIERMGLSTIYSPNIEITHRITKQQLAKEYIYKRGYIEGISSSFTVIRNRGKPGLDFVTILKNIKKKLGIIFSKINLTDEFKINALFYTGYLKGMSDHQDEVYKNKKLYSWVMSDNFMS